MMSASPRYAKDSPRFRASSFHSKAARPNSDAGKTSLSGSWSFVVIGMLDIFLIWIELYHNAWRRCDFKSDIGSFDCEREDSGDCPGYVGLMCEGAEIMMESVPAASTSSSGAATCSRWKAPKRSTTCACGDTLLAAIRARGAPVIKDRRRSRSRAGEHLARAQVQHPSNDRAARTR